jgi:hypothetical protein
VYDLFGFDSRQQFTFLLLRLLVYFFLFRHTTDSAILEQEIKEVGWRVGVGSFRNRGRGKLREEKEDNGRFVERRMKTVMTDDD